MNECSIMKLTFATITIDKSLDTVGRILLQGIHDDQNENEDNDHAVSQLPPSHLPEHDAAKKLSSRKGQRSSTR